MDAVFAAGTADQIHGQDQDENSERGDEGGVQVHGVSWLVECSGIVAVTPL
jgi:hypothetical protein